MAKSKNPKFDERMPWPEDYFIQKPRSVEELDRAEISKTLGFQMMKDTRGFETVRKKGRAAQRRSWS